MKFSIIVATKRDPKTLESLFITTHEESELIIIDGNYNEKTKQWLSEQDGYKQIIYAPCKESPQKWMRNFSQSLNTAICYVENDWIVRADDYIEFKSDFFEEAENNIKKFKDDKFIIIGQKAQAFNNEEPFIDYMDERDKIAPGFRYVKVQNPAFTFSFGICPLKLMLEINGYLEAYDVGYGSEDRDFLHRLLVYGYTAMLDKQLMGYGHFHKPQGKQPIDMPFIIYQIMSPMINNGLIWAYNNFNLKNLREINLKQKKQWIIE